MTGRITSMLAQTFVTMYDQAGIGVTRSCRAQPEARSADKRAPPAVSPATREPNEHIETIR
jgi:hypothetical protein